MSQPRATACLLSRTRLVFTFAVQDGDVIGGQTSLGFDAYEQRAAATSGHAFAREVDALKAQREGTLLLVFHVTNEQSTVAAA